MDLTDCNEYFADLTNTGKEELAERVAEAVVKEFPFDKLAEAILDHPGLLDALVHYARKAERQRAKEPSPRPASAISTRSA